MLLTAWHPLRYYNWLGAAIMWLEREKENEWMNERSNLFSFAFPFYQGEMNHPPDQVQYTLFFFFSPKTYLNKFPSLEMAHLTVFLWFNIQIMEPQLKGSRTLEVVVGDEIESELKSSCYENWKTSVNIISLVLATPWRWQQSQLTIRM